MAYKPIIFSPPMVLALLNNLKSMTRRVMKPQPTLDSGGMWHWRDCQWMDGGIGFPDTGIEDYSRYEPGDILWVKETWMPETEQGIPTGGYIYKATDRPEPDGDIPLRWRSSRYMPRKAARIFLRVTNVRVERVQDITGDDVRREGIGENRVVYYNAYLRSKFADLWNSINAKPKPVYCDGEIACYESFPWEDVQEVRTYRGKEWHVYGNPWVWVYTFERAERPEGWCA